MKIANEPLQKEVKLGYKWGGGDHFWNYLFATASYFNYAFQEFGEKVFQVFHFCTFQLRFLGSYIPFF